MAKRIRTDLTETQANALHDLLSMVLNDPTDWEDVMGKRGMRSLSQVSEKVLRGLRG